MFNIIIVSVCCCLLLIHAKILFHLWITLRSSGTCSLSVAKLNQNKIGFLQTNLLSATKPISLDSIPKDLNNFKSNFWMFLFSSFWNWLLQKLLEFSTFIENTKTKIINRKTKRRTLTPRKWKKCLSIVVIRRRNTTTTTTCICSICQDIITTTRTSNSKRRLLKNIAKFRVPLMILRTRRTQARLMLRLRSVE